MADTGPRLSSPGLAAMLPLYPRGILSFPSCSGAPQESELAQGRTCMDEQGPMMSTCDCQCRNPSPAVSNRMPPQTAPNTCQQERGRRDVSHPPHPHPIPARPPPGCSSSVVSKELGSSSARSHVSVHLFSQQPGGQCDEGPTAKQKQNQENPHCGLLIRSNLGSSEQANGLC